MKIQETALPGSYRIELEPIGDDRGHFARVFCAKELEVIGFTSVAQANTAFNVTKGIVRGLHFQRPPHAEIKLVRCTRGAVFDVLVDIREGSSTFGQWYGETLTPDSQSLLFIPPGFAHGYQVLEDNSELHYMVSAFYQPDAEGGLKWDDPAVGIDWPIKENVVTSARDEQQPLLADLLPIKI